MADAVTTQTLLDGPRHCVMKFTNISDGTGESAVAKVDVSALAGSPSTVRIDRIEYDCSGMGVDVLWDATTPVLAAHCGPSGPGEICATRHGGLINPKATGYTGDIKFTTVGHTSGDRYTVLLHMIKKYG